jgi:hypothetical protein
MSIYVFLPVSLYFPFIPSGCICSLLFFIRIQWCLSIEISLSNTHKQTHILPLCLCLSSFLPVCLSLPSTLSGHILSLPLFLSLVFHISLSLSLSLKQTHSIPFVYNPIKQKKKYLEPKKRQIGDLFIGSSSFWHSRTKVVAEVKKAKNGGHIHKKEKRKKKGGGWDRQTEREMQRQKESEIVLKSGEWKADRDKKRGEREMKGKKEGRR